MIIDEEHKPLLVLMCCNKMNISSQYFHHWLFTGVVSTVEGKCVKRSYCTRVDQCLHLDRRSHVSFFYNVSFPGKQWGGGMRRRSRRGWKALGMERKGKREREGFLVMLARKREVDVW